MMMALAGHLCDQTGNCPDIKLFMVDGLGVGKTMLRANNCLGADLVIMETEKNILTLLVDAAAFYADQLSHDDPNADYLADSRELILLLNFRSFGHASHQYIASHHHTLHNPGLVS
jgi:hypothetical protein